MKTHIIAVLMGGLFYAPHLGAAENSVSVASDRISVFKVPLVCPGAPQIGCGGASKPILLDLERQPGVLEAWLNRAGTRIAVVWKPEANAEARRKVVGDLRQDRAIELTGGSRDEGVRDFLSGKNWYRGADVNRLSEEEAGVIAARLVRWLQGRTTLPKDKAEGFQHALTSAMRKDLTGESDAINHLEDAENIARQYLDQEQMKIMKGAIKEERAIETGERPVPKEN